MGKLTKRIHDGGRWLSTKAWRLGSVSWAMFKGLHHFVMNSGPAISAIATGVIAAYAYFTYGVQQDLILLQRDVVAMQTEPSLSGQIGAFWLGDSLKKDYNYRLTNVGSDTAWSVFDEMRTFILCDTMLVYIPGYAWGKLLRGPGYYHGSYSRYNPIAPAEYTRSGFNGVGLWMTELSNILDGIIILDATFAYWGSSPIKRYEGREYFVFMRLDHYSDSFFEKLTRDQDILIQRIESLHNQRKYAEVKSPTRIGGPTFYDSILDTLTTLVLVSPVPTRSDVNLPWTYQDTFIVTDSGLVDFLTYRRQFGVFRKYEDYLRRKGYLKP